MHVLRLNLIRWLWSFWRSMHVKNHPDPRLADPPFAENRVGYRYSRIGYNIVRVKTPTGLQPFEVNIFFGQKVTKSDLPLPIIIRNHS